MVKKLLAWSLMIALIAVSVPTPVLAAVGKQASGQISGIARDEAQKPNASHVVRLRNLDTNQVVATGRTNASGEFSFTGLATGRCVVEVLDASGNVIGASSTITLTTAVMSKSDVVVFTTVQAPKAGKGFFDSSAGLLLAAAAAAGLTAGVAASRPSASPEK